jgi:hypothetical protein
LDAAHRKLKYNKAPHKDKLHSELFKYAGNLFHNKLLKFLNTIWYDSTTSRSWQKAVVIPVYKKGDTKIQKIIEVLVC